MKLMYNIEFYNGILDIEDKVFCISSPVTETLEGIPLHYSLW